MKTDDRGRLLARIDRLKAQVEKLKAQVEKLKAEKENADHWREAAQKWMDDANQAQKELSEFTTRGRGTIRRLADLILYAYGPGSPWARPRQPPKSKLWTAAQRLLGVAVLCLLPAVASAQIVALNGAWIHNPYVSAAAGEVFLASPPLLHVRPYTIVSWNTSAGAEPTVLARLGYTHAFGQWSAGAGAGFIRLPADRFRPSLSVIAFAPGRWNLRPYAIAAYEKTPAWTWTTFIGLQYTLWFRR